MPKSVALFPSHRKAIDSMKLREYLHERWPEGTLEYVSTDIRRGVLALYALALVGLRQPNGKGVE